MGTSGVDQAQTTLSLGTDGLEASRQTVIDSSPQIPTLTRSADTRNAAQRLTKATLNTGAGNTIISQSLYDSAGRLQRQWGTDDGGSGYSEEATDADSYTYDSTTGLKSGDDLQLASVGTVGTISSSYSYGDDGRLSSATTGDATTDYGFDSAGNLTTVAPQGGTQTTLFYDAANRLQMTWTGTNPDIAYFSWDAAKGWRTSQGPTNNPQDPRVRYSYTSSGCLATYVDELTNPTVSASYTYDAHGQRIQSAVTAGAQTTTSNFAYEGLCLMSLSASQSGGTSNDSWKLAYLYDENDRPYAGIYREPGTSTQPVIFGIITTDRGDVVELIDAAGEPFAAYRYDAWGNPQGAGNVSTGVWSQSSTLVNATIAAAIAVRQPLRYAGYYYDAESGMYYLSAREYDPKTEQFLSKDLAKADGEGSGYQYCGGNPVKNVDPSGNWWSPWQYHVVYRYYCSAQSLVGRTAESVARDVSDILEGIAFFAGHYFHVDSIEPLVSSVIEVGWDKLSVKGFYVGMKIRLIPGSYQLFVGATVVLKGSLF